MRWRFLTLILFLLLPFAAQAQVPATLIADSVTVEGGNRLVASGNIEVFADGTRLTASQITYDRAADRLIIAGPILITAPDGTILTADRATLDPRLENGMLLGARLVLNQQLQLAANQIDRTEGRFSQLYKTAVTSCNVCEGRAPLWEIRAERIVHDEDAGQLYFTGAQFRVAGVPLVYLPRVRLPDPSVDRATGLLIPRIRSTDRLGVGLKLPYFVTLGDHRDLLITPYLSVETRTLEARYRQAFARGDIAVSAAISDDTLRPGEQRGYVFAEGLFDLGRGYRLAFDAEATTDDAYLLDYGYSSKDRLDTAVSLTRITDNALLDASFTYYQTLRDDELNRSLPPIVADVRYDQRFAAAGGTLTLGASGNAIVRYGAGTGDDGRDVTRIGGAATWDRTWVADAGLLTTATADLRADWFLVNDDRSFDQHLHRVVPTLGLTLRYPLSKQTANASHLITPALALAWSEHYGDTPPNESSTRPEFDPANLLSLTRFPGDDAVEVGGRGALGLTYTRVGRGGSHTALTFGRIFRSETSDAFTITSGQRDTRSDWLVAGHVLLPQGLRVAGRSLWSDDFRPVLAQALVDWDTETLNLGAAYIYQIADGEVGRSATVSEWSVDGAVRLSPSWAVSFDARYDIIADAPATAGLGVEWRNECVTVDLSVSRRYTSSTTVDPSTDYGLSVTLAGFSAASITGRPVARCTHN